MKAMGLQGRSTGFRAWTSLLAVVLVGTFVYQHFGRQGHSRSTGTSRNSTSRKMAEYLLDSQGHYQARTFRFDLCNGFANQRVALAYGIVMAHWLGRAAVLPEVLLNGTQGSDDWTLGTDNSTKPLSFVYDSQHLIETLEQKGIVAIETPEAPPAELYTFVAMKNAPADPLTWLRGEGANATHLRIDCAFFRLPPAMVLSNSKHIWAVLDALRPSAGLAEHVQSGVAKLRSLDVSKTNFNFLHMRLENDWLGHCNRWGSIPDGVIRANCFNNTYTPDIFMKSKNVSTETVLYVASSWKEANAELVKKVMMRLVSGGYQVVTQQYLFPTHTMSREEAACVEYYIALESSKFVGNSVSSFAAVLILERQKVGRWATYYNGGNIPMSAALPLYKLPWVFTYNSWSSSYDYMLKAAVRSGLEAETFVPYCLFSGDKAAPVAKWLQSEGVEMIFAEPKWSERLVEGLKKADNKAHSHLYADPQMQIGTWQRIDIPILPELSEWEYVLFTDADVYFRKPITLDSFQQPLPDTIGMASEMDDIFPYNAGVMLMHMPPLQETYDRFIDWIFQNDQGMYFPGFGPGDQGAINQFYEDSVVHAKLGQEFNAKPYFSAQESAYIVHFHGPKPADYLGYLETGNCTFGDMCQRGSTESFCFYALEWSRHIQDEDIGRRLHASCKILLKVDELQKNLYVPAEDDTHVPAVLSKLY